MASLDRSGRLSARALLRTLGWRPGRRVNIDVVDGALMVETAEADRPAVGGRGELVLPAAALRLCGIVSGQPVVLAAYPSLDMLVIHPADAVARLLGEFHARLAAARPYRPTDTFPDCIKRLDANGPRHPTDDPSAPTGLTPDDPHRLA